jgi:alpha-ketoglutarate-dependent 2,4-dichlorophenoxyacetate dioxygenase
MGTMAIQIRKLTENVGAEITGIDITKPIDDASFGLIFEAFNEYSVLVFHNQDFDDDQQIAFSQHFGALETTVKSNIGGGTYIADISNIDPETNEILPVDSWRIVYNSGNEMWHTDSSFKPVPAMASLLSGREVPPEGAETEFGSMRAAYAALPPAEQERLEGLVAEHDFSYSRGLVDPELLNDDHKNETPPVRQAVVRTNLENGKKAFYTGSHASHIVGWPVEEGRALLKDLVARATQPEFTYSHNWQAKDLVIWDNRCVLHRGRPWDKARYRRVMHRTTVAGDGPTAPAA